MKTKKCGAYIALAAVLLISAALITSCIDPLGPGGLTVPQSGAPADFTPTTPTSTPISASTPAIAAPSDPVQEVGYLQLKIAAPESKARTILPTGALPTIAEYEVILTFTEGGAGATIPRIEVGVGLITDPISVQTGEYNVEVRGYASVGGTVPVALGSASDVEVTTSGTTGGPAAVALHEVYLATGTGTFGWNFTLTSAGTLTTATLTVTKWSDNSATTVTDRDIISTGTNTASLAAGFYYADVTLTRTGNYRSQTYREIIHVANGMTTTWGKNDFKPLGLTVYSVTYKNSDGAGTDDVVTGQTHNSILTEPDSYTWSGVGAYEIEGWYRTYTPPDPPADAIFANKWNFDTQRIINNLTLYPKWVEVQNGDLNITVTYTISGDESFTLTGTGLSGDTLAYPSNNFYLPTVPNISVTITNAGGFDTGTITWKWNDVEATTVRTVSTGATLTIDFASVTIDYTNLKKPGTHNITIEAKIGDKPYSGTLVIDIE